ncbi:MAG: GntR family transcriptional regulator [Rhodospirillales bacterium]|nr:GntR family transcriptional regulator [Rhodospirillales bacterium]
MAGPVITRIDQRNLRENAYEELRNAFTRGEFAPGDVVNLRSLAQQMGTSMTPVREAVRRLVAEGALIDTPSRTLEVPQFDLERMQDLMRARLALETLVVDLAMDKIDDATIEALEETTRRPRLSESGEIDQTANYDFHFTLYRACGSKVLLPLIEALWLQYGAYLHLIAKHPDVESIAEHSYHQDIIDALRRGDRDEAKQALTCDIERSFRVLNPEPGE